MTERANTINDPFNQEFCSALEHHLSSTFANSEDQYIKTLWCDGISDAALLKSKKSVNDTRKITTRAWIGPDGQTEFEMTILFGKYSLRRYAKGTSLEDCIPDDTSMDWIIFDFDKRTIEVNLK